MQYGISLPPFAELSDPRVLASLARDAEEAGWDGFFLWDHLLYGPIPVADPWVALAAIALGTQRIRLGPMVTPLPRRRPVKLAREVLSLDQLSGGRLTLGVGIGQGPWEWEYLGDEPDLRVRGDMLDEGLEVLSGLISGEPVNHRGEHYTVEGESPSGKGPAQLVRASGQNPRVPIWVAGTWPNKRPFRRAARWDGVFPLKAGGEFGEMLSPDELRAIVAYIRRFRTSPDPFQIVMSGVTPGDDPNQAAQVVSEYAEVGLTWWIEDVHPWRFGWQWEGPWPVEAMAERIRLGPPRVES